MGCQINSDIDTDASISTCWTTNQSTPFSGSCADRIPSLTKCCPSASGQAERSHHAPSQSSRVNRLWRRRPYVPNRSTSPAPVSKESSPSIWLSTRIRSEWWMKYCGALLLCCNIYIHYIFRWTCCFICIVILYFFLVSLPYRCSVGLKRRRPLATNYSKRPIHLSLLRIRTV